LTPINIETLFASPADTVRSTRFHRRLWLSYKMQNKQINDIYFPLYSIMFSQYKRNECLPVSAYRIA